MEKSYVIARRNKIHTGQARPICHKFESKSYVGRRTKAMLSLERKNTYIPDKYIFFNQGQSHYVGLGTKVMLSLTKNAFKPMCHISGSNHYGGHDPYILLTSILTYFSKYMTVLK